MNGLPSDILRYMFAFSWGHQLCLVCQRWSSLVHLTHVSAAGLGRHPPVNVLLATDRLTSAQVPLELRYLRCLTSCARLRELTVLSAGSWSAGSTKLYEPLLEALEDLMPRLQKLVAKGVGTVPYLAAMDWSQALRLEAVRWEPEDDNWDECSLQQQIKKLSALRSCPRLAAFEITRCIIHQDTLPSLVNVARNPSLRRIRLRYCNHYTAKGVPDLAILPSLSRLTDLDLELFPSRFEDVSHEGFCNTLAGSTALQRLSLRGDCHFWSFSLQHLRLPGFLRELHLGLDLEHILEWKAVFSCILACPSLCKLSLDFGPLWPEVLSPGPQTNSVAAYCWDCLLLGLPNLQVLQLRATQLYCVPVSLAALPRLRGSRSLRTLVVKLVKLYLTEENVKELQGLNCPSSTVAVRIQLCGKCTSRWRVHEPLLQAAKAVSLLRAALPMAEISNDTEG